MRSVKNRYVERGFLLSRHACDGSLWCALRLCVMRFVVLALVGFSIACGDDNAATDAGPDSADTSFEIQAYEDCASVACTAEAPSCEPLTVVWEGIAITGSRCTLECSLDAECPTSARGNSALCVNFGDTGDHCYETCSSDTDCASGSRCGDFGFLQTLCFPG